MPPTVQISEANPADFAETLARLEADIFNDDPICCYGFGPDRGSPDKLAKRAEELREISDDCRIRMNKAVTSDGAVVGASYWKFFPESWDALAGDKGSDSKWPEGANVELCEAVFGASDENRKRTMTGKAYALCNIMVVVPEYQRMGIGTMLMKDALKVVDEAGMPAWLGASEKGLGLYLKSDFRVDQVIEIDMTKYGGNTIEKQTCMIRPARRSS
ncbi:MAG: hypothetical protein M1818_000322 [Claussenomyces sp. TS43310]|nr:MAG: hypothetical protein M1818_000322 [Claussenomyces sp. TS43310]